MTRLWHRFWSPLTPGVRVLLGVLLLSYLISLVPNSPLRGSMPVSGPTVRAGQFWRLGAYWLLPASFLDLLFTGAILAALGTALERFWSRYDLWIYCLIAAVGAGLVKVVLQPSNPLALQGASPVFFGLLVAWGRLFGHQRIPFFGSSEIPVRQAAAVFGVIGLLTTWFTAGWVMALIVASGGGFGFVYLWIRSQLASGSGREPAVSQRISRLEL